MWNNIVFQLLILFMIFTIIHIVYSKVCEKKEKPVPDEKTPARTVRFADEQGITAMGSIPTLEKPKKVEGDLYNLSQPIYEPVLSDEFLYEDSVEPGFAESRANEGHSFDEYPDNCNDQRTIGEIHDEFLFRDIKREMNDTKVDGIYEPGQYEIGTVGDMGYSDFATY